jgi:hypothetical protein
LDCSILLCLLTFFGFISVSVVSNGFLGLWVSVHKEINHNIPRGVTGNFSSELKNLTSEQPEAEGNGVARFVVGWDCDVDIVEW